MGDSLKLFKDKRHRSSSSIAGVALEGTLSERKLDIKASIPEGDDQFVIAEARCDDLQEKIDLVKILKKKRKLKKRSVTRIMEQHPPDENIPFISVRTQPKKKSSQQARGYKDPDLVEQHRMISETAEMNHKLEEYMPRSRARGGRPSGDGKGTCGRGVQITTHPVDPRFSADETEDYSATDNVRDMPPTSKAKNKPTSEVNRPRSQGKAVLRRSFVKDSSNEEEERLPLQPQKSEKFNKLSKRVHKRGQNAERPVVELFNKNQDSSSVGSSQGMAQVGERGKGNDRDAELQDGSTGPEGVFTQWMVPSRGEVPRSVRRLRKQARRNYEMPTVASKMKQTRARYYVATTNATKIPFITSKSTGPSHNIGINIQQVLNALKTRQPPSGIPKTIAHHMGFRQCPVIGTRSSHGAQELDTQDLNTIKLGRRLLRLPIHKLSYNRLLELFREGEGMVPRFLSGVTQPHYSMSECKPPNTKKCFFGMVNSSTLRASVSTAGGGYHQTSNMLDAGDAIL